jgi:hypothetical protein
MGHGAGEEDAFLSKLNPTRSVLLFSTFFGGNSCDVLYDVAIDSTGSAFIVGNTSSDNLPMNKAVQDLYRQLHCENPRRSQRRALIPRVLCGS